MKVLPSVPQTEGARGGFTAGRRQEYRPSHGELLALGQAKQ